MITDKLTWVGFMVAAFGWTLLLSAPQLSELYASLTWRSGGNLNMPAIAQCVIVTGFGIAIIGALRTGFGALNKFLSPYLKEAVTRGRGDRAPLGTAEKIVERGWVKDRAYLLYMDGSVEVETMLGRRVFPSLQDAQEFIA